MAINQFAGALDFGIKRACAVLEPQYFLGMSKPHGIQRMVSFRLKDALYPGAGPINQAYMVLGKPGQMYPIRHNMIYVSVSFSCNDQGIAQPHDMSMQQVNNPSYLPTYHPCCSSILRLGLSLL